MKKLAMIMAWAVCAAVGTVQADLITDDFNRANTTYSSDIGTSVGGDWINGGLNANAQYRILDGMVQFGVGSANNPIINAGLETESGGDYSFTLSGINELYNAAINVGMVFNYQDEDNYYYTRYLSSSKTLQVLRRVDGTETSFASLQNNDMPTFANPMQYEFEITSVAAYAFSVTVRELSTSESIVLAASDANENFTGGYAGFWSSSGGNTSFDDFRLEVIPEPTTMSLMGMVLIAALIRRRLLP